MTGLSGRTAIVTGAGSGIGRAIATRFVGNGARVVVNDVVEDRLVAVVDELSEVGEVHGVVGDVSSVADCERVVSECRRRFGGIDILANNAGIARYEPFITHSLENWDDTLRTNLTAMFILGQMAATVMVDQGQGGAIVNMASTNGIMGERNLTAYNVSKAGVILLTKTMAIELAKYRIRVNSVSPGAIATGLGEESRAELEVAEGESKYIEEKVPLGRSGRPDDVATVFAFLASDEAGFMTGSNVVVDGGQLSEE